MHISRSCSLDDVRCKQVARCNAKFTFSSVLLVFLYVKCDKTVNWNI